MRKTMQRLGSKQTMKIQRWVCWPCGYFIYPPCLYRCPVYKGVGVGYASYLLGAPGHSLPALSAVLSAMVFTMAP